MTRAFRSLAALAGLALPYLTYDPAFYDEATDGTTPGTDVVPRVTLFFSW